MKYVPHGHEERKTARGWDPRAHEDTAKVGTPGPMTERAVPTAGGQVRRSPRVTRGGGVSDAVRAQEVEATLGRQNLNVSAQDKSNQMTITDEKESCLSLKLIGWCSGQKNAEMRMRSTSRSTRPRKVWRTTALPCGTLSLKELVEKFECGDGRG